MKKSLYTFTLFLFSFISPLMSIEPWLMNSPNEEEQRISDILNKVIDKNFYQTVQKDYGLNHFITVGTVGSSLLTTKKLHKVKVIFYGMHRMSIENARLFQLQIADSLLSIINSAQAIRPYMYKYPFDSNDLSLQMWFIGQDGYLRKKNWIGNSFLDNGEIFYSTVKFTGLLKKDGRKEEDLVLIKKESYKEALKTSQINAHPPKDKPPK